MEIALIRSYTQKPWRSPETFQLMEDSLGAKWRVFSTSTKQPEKLHQFLSKLQAEHEGLFVFNVAEYLDEEHKQGFLPDLLERWQMPHLGSSAESVSVGLDKAQTKTVLQEQGIPTPAFFVAEGDDGELEAKAAMVGYPLMVKPLEEGGRLGISSRSIVRDATALRAAVRRVADEFGEPALVEQYISGPGMREFSVGIIDGEPQLVIPMEIDFKAMGLETDILSYEAAQNDLERIKLVTDKAVAKRITDLARRTFRAVGAEDYCRVDLRMDAQECYVLEINLMPGMGPHSFLPEGAYDLYGLDYAQLIQRLASSSILSAN